MSVGTSAVIGAVVVGAGATLGMDLWNLFLKRAFGIASLNYCFLGRWLCHMSRGTFTHRSISVASPMPLECVAGWVAHYTIGLVFALAFVLAVPGWLAQPTIRPAILYGIATVVFPFLVLQPSLGFGIAGSRTTSPTRSRLKSLATHTVFGLGLYLSALVINQVQRALS